MKKITLVVISLFVTLLAFAQQPQPLPIDPNVKFGKLDNGLTYYIRHNKYPEKRADFYIAQKVGSMQEEDNQAGLAHFLEHMAFNGTKHYPGRKTMLNYLESIGAKFGANVNAYTGFDETVYTLNNIPVVRQSIIDSTLLILHDWSGYITLENAEIDKERPIIKEEWRTRNSAGMRILEKQLPIIFEGSKYADRLPIGKMEVVENFDYQVIKDYYKKWYRPDLQAIIVVGDIDAEKVEAQVKEMFSTIPMPENAAERVYHSVPNNDDPIISILSDKEESRSTIYHFVKHDPLPAEIRQTEMGYSLETVIGLAATMLSERLSEISKTAESPFTASYAFDGDYFVSKSKKAWTSIVLSKEGQEKESLASIIREVERARLFGFTDAELERAKANLLSRLEQTYNNRDKQQNNSYVQEYVRSFSDDEPIPGIEYEYDMAKRLLPSISSDVLNGVVAKLLTKENNVITITAPEKEGLKLPSKDEALAIVEAVRAEKIEGYMEEVITEPLVSNLPKAGTIVKEDFNETLGITTWTLSNGMKVAFKSTDFKNDEIMMSAISYGGFSWAGDNDIYEAGFISHVPYLGGLGNFNANDIKKVLAGKNANVNVSVGEWTHGLSGRSSIKDLETMLQLTYLSFTSARKDEAMFTNLKNMVVSQLRNLENNPSNAFSRNVAFARYGSNIRKRPMNATDAENLNYDKIIELYKQAFANPGSFTITFVGNVDKDVFKPLVETYLASLPSGDKDAKYNKVNIDTRKGSYKATFDEKMIDPKTSVFATYTGTLEFSKTNLDRFSALKQVLDIAYTETIREAEGGTYGVGVGAYLTRVPEGDATLFISFDTNPEKVEKLLPLVHGELQNMVKDGVKEEYFMKVKEYMLKKYEEDIKTNSYWLGITSDKTFYNEDLYSPALESIKSMTKEDVQAIAKNLLDQKNLTQVVMNPLAK